MSYLKVVARALSRPAQRSVRLVHSSPAAKQAKEAVPELNWDEFFRLRKQRRLWERLGSLPCAILGLGGGAAVFASLPVDPQQTFMGLDPLMLFGGCSLFSGALGFVIGPSVGRRWYRVINRDLARALDNKEAEFFKHVRMNRSDPSLSSASNPLPDFYGEKINSLQSYRRWLRKQREHERKGTFNLGAKRR
ncbi:TIM23 complex component [Coemansia brasiliensis]|uniref:Presequence translocated-associated motor subunit PAM17 n=1 Tax=Coemansia brasiliensis TaxID=2650707 RepID=A0A9W8I8Q3_9FUNG|nr:TIM23 complex component [Coemansia brasiliensis]